MYETNEFRKGLKIEIDKNPYQIIDHQFVKPGKGQAFTRVKVKNLLNGSVLEKTYKSGEKVPPANIEDVSMQFLYQEGDSYHFMNLKTYDQIELNIQQIEDSAKWLQEEMQVTVLFYNDNPISITLPIFCTMKVTYCEPGVKGDTATGATKPATVESGASLQVPLFVNQGDTLKIDTRTGGYVERVK